MLICELAARVDRRAGAEGYMADAAAKRDDVPGLNLLRRTEYSRKFGYPPPGGAAGSRPVAAAIRGRRIAPSPRVGKRFDAGGQIRARISMPGLLVLG